MPPLRTSMGIYKLKTVFIDIYLEGPFFSSCLKVLRSLSSGLHRTPFCYFYKKTENKKLPKVNLKDNASKYPIESDYDFRLRLHLAV